MNIFVTDPNPYASAAALDDKRVVKMCLETAQILSTAVWAMDPAYHARAKLYKPTHVRHPVVRWVRESGRNMLWTWHHFNALLMEYAQRYGKQHACEKLLDPIGEFIDELSDAIHGVENFCNCTPYPKDSVFMAYQQLLNDKWDNDKREPTWYGEAR